MPRPRNRLASLESADGSDPMSSAPLVLTLNGTSLDFVAFARIGRPGTLVAIDEAARLRVREGRRTIEAALAGGGLVYGANTGVGALKDVEMSPADLDRFNAGLVRAHHFGTGEAFAPEIVRTAMAIRVNSALSGLVGCTEGLVDAYVALINAGVVPVVRRTGSIGCADIGLMGQIGAVLTGVGEALWGDRRMPAELALAAAGLAPIRMAPKDSLVSISSNAVGFSAALHTLRRGAAAVRVLAATGLATASAMGASPAPWEAAAHVGSQSQARLGAWLHRAGASKGTPVSTHVHDPLSLRMMAQVLAATFDALANAGQVTLAAAGRPDDNPVVIDGRVLTSGGSLPLDVALALQQASLALAHAARNSFNRCILIGNGHRRDLTVNLVPRGVAATGFGPIMKLAGELFARTLTLAQPISAQAMVVADGIEDEAAFLPLVVERFERQVEAIRRLAALEGLLAAQAIDLMGDRPGGVVALVYEIVRRHAAFYSEDRPLSAEVEAIEEALVALDTMALLIETAPLPEVDGFFGLGLAL